MRFSKTTISVLAFVCGGFMAIPAAQAQTTGYVDGDVDVADWALQAAGQALWHDLETCTILEAPRSCIPDEVVGPTRPWFTSGYLDAVSDWVTQRIETEG